MTYTTLMVHLEVGQPNAGLLQIASDLAERFKACVIGIAACQPMPMIYSDGMSGGYVDGGYIEQERKELDRQIKVAEAEFRNAFQGRAAHLEWRSQVLFSPPADYLAREARSADLVITRAATGGVLDAVRTMNTGDFVMRVGRPVLIVPSTVQGSKLDRVVVGWKDTRETQRAIATALPLLKMAKAVSVIEIAAEEDMATARRHLDDVVGWLERHGIAAKANASLSTGDDATRLDGLAQDYDADVIVAGAYGHNRIREWAFGGVTRDLLLRADRCCLVSH
jgi:nucleotide-binding universal stress UspA family protein